MAESSSAFLITRMLGISGSLFLSGFAFSASYYSLPAIDLAPLPLRLKQWQVVYDLGKLVAPPVAGTSGLAWGIAAWNSYSSSTSTSAGSDWKFYAAAGLLTFAFIPWTLFGMRPTNNELMRRAKVAGEVEGEAGQFVEESEAALKRWGWMNFVRFALPLVGAWVGLFAALN